MEIAVRTEGKDAVVTVTGRLDSVTSAEFIAQFDAWLANAPSRLILDFTGVEYLSSAGLRAIQMLSRRCREAGSGFCLCGLAPFVKNVLSLSGFDRALTIHPTLADALSAG